MKRIHGKLNCCRFFYYLKENSSCIVGYECNYIALIKVCLDTDIYGFFPRKFDIAVNALNADTDLEARPALKISLTSHSFATRIHSLADLAPDEDFQFS